MKEITLTKGFVALVSDEDYPKVSAYCWYASDTGSGHVYAVRNLRGGGREYLHQAIAGRPDDGLVIDHINGDTMDNRRENLRHATRSANAVNSHCLVRNKTGYRGVHPIRNKWFALIKRNAQPIYLGVFETPEAAAAAIDAYLSGEPQNQEAA